MFTMAFRSFTLPKYSFHVMLLACLFKSSAHALYKGCLEFTNLQIQFPDNVIQYALIKSKRVFINYRIGLLDTIFEEMVRNQEIPRKHHSYLDFILQIKNDRNKKRNLFHISLKK